MSAGDHVVASQSLYGGSINLFGLTLPRFVITTTFVDPRDPDAFKAAIQPNTQMVFAEVLGNPALEVLDIETIAGVAHDAGLTRVIDASFSTPYLCRPIDFGADIVMHSATKWLGGHGVSMGGILVAGGRFDWTVTDDEGASKLPNINEPNDHYHGRVLAADLVTAANIMRVGAHSVRDTGPVLSPAQTF